ncbi:MAG: hypothetical protein ACJ76D_10880 [Solirubrobacterales bacterium]
MQDPFFECNQIQFHIVDPQPETFIARLPLTDRAKLEVACEATANAFADRTPPVRSRLVRGAKMHDLFVIFIEWPRAPGPKAMLLARRVGNRVLIARGLRSRDGGIPPVEAERAERALAKAREDDGLGGGCG